ncbi:metallophosphoesterase [Actinomycetes bacterium KLBMP 9797]
MTEDLAAPVEATPTTRPRPRTLDPIELGFTPRGPVPWLAPLLLLSTGLRTLLHHLFGAYLDKRELQNSLPDGVHQQPGTGGELWLDYVADLGDGFDATYSVAYLLAQPELRLDGRRLPRGEVLIMGGDQVYPTASGVAYEERCKGPYQAALPCVPSAGPQPTLFAIAGNHDWYDGLTAFLRLFARRKDGSIGGWRTAQHRSYFATQLPGKWWLWGIDEQFGAYLDDPQLIYFEKAAQQLTDDDRVILVVPAPSWVKAEQNPDAYDAIDYFIRTVIAPTGAQVRLMISGDLHHYARYEGADRHLVTCGGGGAYLYPTHKLSDEISVPPPDTKARRSSVTRHYRLASCYPTAERSRRYSWDVFRRLPFRNPGFATMIGILHTLLMLAMTGVANSTGRVEERIFSVPLAVICTLIMMGAVLFAQPSRASGKHHALPWLLGIGHGLAHIGLGALGTWLWLQLPFVDWSWPMPVIAAAVVYGPVAGFMGAQLVSAYLLTAGTFGVNLNELYAGQGIEDAKSFLRMHIAADGTLTVYPVAIDDVCHSWRPNPDAPDDSPWLEPREELSARLAEREPIVIHP